MELSSRRDFTVIDGGPAMPDGLMDLASEADRDGVRNVTTLIAKWVDGSERYDGPGESLRIARSSDDGRVIGVGGRARCPDVQGAIRLRRFYVAVDWRRRGVARALAEELMSEAGRYTDRLTCNAKASAAAALFWESMGFVPVDAMGITHIRASA